jgi:acyl carrier protein
MKRVQEITDKINGILSEEFEVEIHRFSPGANIRELLELDSLDYVDLVVLIENNFLFKVKPEDLTVIISLRDLYEYINLRVKHNQPGDVTGQAGEK